MPAEINSQLSEQWHYRRHFRKEKIKRLSPKKLVQECKLCKLEELKSFKTVLPPQYFSEYTIKMCIKSIMQMVKEEIKGNEKECLMNG